MDFQSIFDLNASELFHMYSSSHVIWIIIFVMMAWMLWRFRHRIRTSTATQRVLRYSLIGMLILPEGIRYLWYTVEGYWDIRVHLPLELCSISLYLSIIMLITRNYLLYQIMVFAGVGGAMQALLTPNLEYAFPHFIYFHFFICHLAIILASLYMTWVEQFRPRLKSIGITMIFLNILAVVVGTINYILQSNYMFLRHKPNTASILDWLGPYPYYLLVEELFALTVFLLLYVFFREKKNVRQSA
ncbi:hypothetical protein BVG16_29640 [Paenibacillus selenitireducens]|uniref:TIGR02206 family membrane protein n=1 Tax=Paenibacillus selenitireducens TaxID=1324314 RepID=A0A1T2X099_9BACL|nr:TIGR02206 family membrane protein [Paenibacillus selenitireducens]OPA73245.1 hypothetical protein BVG16_29640 [Paenibacillus selenitireducens]